MWCLLNWQKKFVVKEAVKEETAVTQSQAAVVDHYFTIIKLGARKLVQYFFLINLFGIITRLYFRYVLKMLDNKHDRKVPSFYKNSICS